jgi:hypothetical protein
VFLARATTNERFEGEPIVTWYDAMHGDMFVTAGLAQMLVKSTDSALAAQSPRAGRGPGRRRGRRPRRRVNGQTTGKRRRRLPRQATQPVRCVARVVSRALERRTRARRRPALQPSALNHRLPRSVGRRPPPEHGPLAPTGIVPLPPRPVPQGVHQAFAQVSCPRSDASRWRRIPTSGVRAVLASADAPVPPTGEDTRRTGGHHRTPERVNLLLRARV